MGQTHWKTKQKHLLNLLAGQPSKHEGPITEWSHLSKWLIGSNLGAAAYQYLGPIYPKLKPYLQEAYYGNIYRDTAQKQVFSEMLSSLKGHKMDIMLLKGAALGALAWDGESHLRFQSDIDFLVQRPELQTIANVLHEANFRFRKPDAIDSFYDDLPDTNKEGQLEMVSPSDSRVVLEAHTEVFLGHVQRITAERVEDDLWKRRIDTKVDGIGNAPNSVRFTRLSNEDLVIHTMIHTAINHQFDENTLRNMLDVIRLANRIPINWEVVAERVKMMRMTTAVWLFMHVSAQIWHVHPFKETLAQLKPSGLRQRLLARFITVDLVLSREILRLSRRRYGLLLLMIDRPIDMLRVLMRLPKL
ncbi:MAG: nucleotidyltransferase family protein [Chloroflexota bacterium]